MKCIRSDHPENGHADNTLFYWGKVCWSLLINTSPESSHQHTAENKCQTQDAAVTSSRFVRGRVTEIQYFLIEQKKFKKKEKEQSPTALYQTSEVQTCASLPRGTAESKFSQNEKVFHVLFYRQ